jgi:hypothetical protein
MADYGLVLLLRQARIVLGDARPPKRAPLPAKKPWHEIRHEPESACAPCGCQMKHAGEDLAKKQD